MFSNHPVSKNRALVENLSKRISNLTSGQIIFGNSVEYYNTDLVKSGYCSQIKHKLNPKIKYLIGHILKDTKKGLAIG